MHDENGRTVHVLLLLLLHPFIRIRSPIAYKRVMDLQTPKGDHHDKLEAAREATGDKFWVRRLLFELLMQGDAGSLFLAGKSCE